jgi:flagellar P-ring protein FlgI
MKILTFLAIFLSMFVTFSLVGQIHERFPRLMQERYAKKMESIRGAAVPGRAIKIRDLTSVVGEESVKLTGFGVVTGLNGTGDGARAAIEMLLNVAKSQGLRISSANVDSQNVALVSISATVNPHERTFDIAVKSIGDAKSLQNGVLEASTLHPIGSSEVFGVASGPLALGARHFQATGAAGADVAGIASVTIGHPTVGFVIDGGELLQEIPSHRMQQGKMTFFVKYPNNRTATNIADIINEYMLDFGMKAYPQNASTVVVNMPKDYEGRNDLVTRLIADIGELPVKVSRKAVITIDQGSGVIAMTEGVKMEPGSIAVSGLTVTVSSDITPVSRQGAFDGETSFVDIPELEVSEDQANFLTLPAGTDLRKVQETLNALKMKPTSIISVFNAMHEAGMIHAEIRVLPR